ncbi:MAG: AAA family ATPase [Prevotella sp.]|jgi:predicted ATP-binding protein involved in virulence|nr:AAA family ATPase [Prevotella sp.]
MNGFKILSLEILPQTSKNLLKVLHPGTYIFDRIGTGSMEDFFGKNINIYAIVGMNGSGKSSLIEMIFRIANNVSYYLVETSKIVKAADKPIIIPGIYANLKYEVDGTSHEIIIRDKAIGIKTGQLCQRLSEAEHDDLKDFQFSGKLNYGTRRDIAKSFFYTIVTNYSLQAYNSSDYLDETGGTNSWIDKVFHKNDGYMTPIVLNPSRTKGVLKLNNESELAKSRLEALLVEAKKRKRTFISGYELDYITCSHNLEHVVDVFSKHVKKFKSFEALHKAATTALNDGNSCLSNILKEYGIAKYNGKDKVRIAAILYLVYKTFSIPNYYPAYNRYKDNCNFKNIFQTISTEDSAALHNLVNELRKDRSHITTKLAQTLAFLNNYGHLIDIVLDSRKTFTFEEYDKGLVSEKKSSSLEAIMRRMPPPIFSSKLFLKPITSESIDNQDSNESMTTNEGEGNAIPFFKLSSGERQFLYMMSTIIYHVMNIKSIPANRIAYRNINLILDEVEICFHPEYQRTFIYNLVRIISFLNLNKTCHFNIIITTHSPFILSDFPKENLICLKDGKIDEEAMKNPFAANVNDILFQNFFLSNGFIGEYVKNKTLSLIEFLEHKQNKDNWTEERARTFIDHIGEPFLKSKLNDLLDIYGSR